MQWKHDPPNFRTEDPSRTNNQTDNLELLSKQDAYQKTIVFVIDRLFVRWGEYSYSEYKVHMRIFVIVTVNTKNDPNNLLNASVCAMLHEKIYNASVVFINIKVKPTIKY